MCFPVSSPDAFSSLIQLTFSLNLEHSLVKTHQVCLLICNNKGKKLGEYAPLQISPSAVCTCSWAVRWEQQLAAEQQARPGEGLCTVCIPHAPRPAKSMAAQSKQSSRAVHPSAL